MAKDSWNFPALFRKIAEDVPFIQRAFHTLVKFDPSEFSDTPVDAKRLKEVSTGNWQIQRYNGTSWEVLKKMNMDADTVDGFQTSIESSPKTVVVRGEDGKMRGDVTGNADTASSATTLSQTLEVSKGGTGATTSAEARRNLGAAPVSHASTGTDYGMASNTNYGHVKLSDAHDSTSGQTAGVAATPAAVKKAYDDGTRTASSSVQGQVKASTTSQAGAVPVMGSDGKLDKSTLPIYNRAVGTFFLWPYPTPPNGALACNGQTVDRKLYKDLYDYMYATGRVITDRTWQDYASGQNGSCPYFSSGNGSTNFRLPKFAPYVKVTNTPSEAGQYFEAGLPNITGTVSASFYGGPHGVGGITSSKGVFKAKEYHDYAPLVADIKEGVESYSSVDIDASRSNPIYGKSNTVQPESMNWIVCVQAFGVAENIGNVDVANVVNALNDKVNVDLSNAPNIVTTNTGQNIGGYKTFDNSVGIIGNTSDDFGLRISDKTTGYGCNFITRRYSDYQIGSLELHAFGKWNTLVLKTYTDGRTSLSTGASIPAASNSNEIPTTAWVRARINESLTQNGTQVVKSWHEGSSWYRKYSDGFIIQGGTRPSQQWAYDDYIMTLHTPFATTDYYASVKGAYGRTSETYYAYFACYDKTTSNFRAKNNSDKYMSVYWIAMGY